jgi:hypothetical protein
MAAQVRLDHAAPRRGEGERGQRLERLSHAVQGHTALQDLTHDQALERDPDREEIQHVLAGQLGNDRAPDAPALKQPFVTERLDGGPDCRPRDTEGRGELELGEPFARHDATIEDARARRPRSPPRQRWAARLCRTLCDVDAQALRQRRERLPLVLGHGGVAPASPVQPDGLRTTRKARSGVSCRSPRGLHGS